MPGVAVTADRAMQTAGHSASKPLRAARRMRITGLIMAILVLGIAPLDTVFGLFDLIYPEGSVPRTHPLTWTCLLVAVFATFQQRPLRKMSLTEQGLFLTVILIALIKPWAGPVVDGLLPQFRLGSMGWNTSATFILIALGQLVRNSRPVLGLVCALLGVFLPLVALNGFMLGNDDFYGQMAAPTALATFGLGLANLLRFARRPSFRLILHDSAAGRLVRSQVLLWVGLACAMPIALRLIDIANGPGFAILYTAQMAVILGAILHFGVRFTGLLDNARRLERELVREATTDPLTGAATRRAAVSHFVKNSWRQPIGVIMIDLDHFKQVNDVHGHAAGDKVLQAVVKALRSDLRLTDMIARWGGEELLVLIPTHDLASLRKRAESLRACVEEATTADASIPSVTASVGVAIAKPELEPDMSAAIDRADTALYEAKAAGRNTVIMFKDHVKKPKIAKAA